MNLHLQKLAYVAPQNPYSLMRQNPYALPAPYVPPQQPIPQQQQPLPQQSPQPQPVAPAQQEPSFGLVDGAELALDVGTSFIPFGGAIWNGLKAGYHGLTGQKDKMKADLGWAAAGLIPFSGAAKGLAKTVGIGSKFLKSSPRIAAAAPHLISMGGNAAAATAAQGAINQVAPTAPPPPMASPTSQFSGNGGMNWGQLPTTQPQQ